MVSLSNHERNHMMPFSLRWEKRKMTNMGPLVIAQALSAVFVKFEKTLRDEPGKSIKAFCDELRIPPNTILYSEGFQGVVLFCALVPLREVLKTLNDSQITQITKDKLEKLRIARNSICHGSYEFRAECKVRFQDQNNKVIEMGASEIVELSNELIQIYLKSFPPNSHETL